MAADVLFLAFANGSNDDFKGVATLPGSGTADYRKALLWGVFTTAGNRRVRMAIPNKQ